MEKTLYKMIYTDLLKLILAGELKAGMKVKTEKQLSEEYGVSRITSKKALNMLAAEGYIERRPGAGSIVINTSPAQKTKKPQLSSPKVIGLLMESLDGYFNATLAKYISQYAHERGYHLLIQDSLTLPEVECAGLSIFTQFGVQGIILSPCMEKTISMELMKTLVDGCKVVTINRELVGMPASLVSSDHEGGVQQMVDHLTGLGCRHIGYISNSFQRSSGVQLRANYFETLMMRRGILNPPMVTITQKEDFYGLALQFFREHPELDGVIVFNSNFLKEIKKALVDAGRRETGDVAIACWERVDRDDYPGDDVACIAQPEKELARKAVDILIDAIDSGSMEPRRVILPTTLLPGNFTFRRE